MFSTRFVLLLLGSGLAASALAGDERRFVFSYQFVEGSEMAPRGGDSEGPEVTLDPEPHPGWEALQAPGLDAFERDRRAILAMAGPYRTSFDFIEVEGYTPDFEPDRPYQSWGTEYVYVVEDLGEFISLQHILVMRRVGEDGEPGEPIIVKHWRQDWQYEDERLLEHVGDGVWRASEVPAPAREGRWSQAVYQVDDAPRYEAIGRWRHEPGFSSWEGGRTRRPLPRREFSVRDDYDVLVGTNVHTVTPDGWVHRQDNLKAVLDEEGRVERYLARELGVNRYRRIVGYDFSPGHEYWERTGEFWRDVRRAWDSRLSAAGRIELREEVDGERRFAPLFRFAADVGEDYDSADGYAYASEVLERYLAAHGTAAAAGTPAAETAAVGTANAGTAAADSSTETDSGAGREHRSERPAVSQVGKEGKSYD